jgi:NADPH:quinone reductase-like Zn-dependent oxidoreductase
MDRTMFAARRPRVATRGTDLAGVVEAVGNSVTAWQPGDAVFGEGIGTFADYAVAVADQLAAVPAGTSFQEAAALPLAATTALLCLEKARLKPRGFVLVNGASGGVGTFAVQAAKTRGLHVTAVVSTRNVALARSLGADAVIDYMTTNFTRTGHTYDAVVDLVGNRRLHDLRRSVRPGGSLVLSGGGTPGSGRLVGPLRLLIGAMAVARFQPFEVTVPQAVKDSRTLAHVADLVGSGSLQPLIDRRFPWRTRRLPSATSRPSTREARSSSPSAERPTRAGLCGRHQTRDLAVERSVRRVASIVRRP